MSRTLLVRGEGVGLPTRSVERGDQLGVEPLTQRVVGDEGLQLLDHVAVETQGEVCIDLSLMRGEHELLDPCGRLAGRRDGRPARRGAGLAPSAMAARKRSAAAAKSAVDHRAPAEVHELLELVRVDGARLDGEGVPDPLAHNDLAPQQSAEVRHLGLQRVDGLAGWVVSPDLVDQAIGRDAFRGGQREQGEQGLELGAHDRDGPVPRRRLDVAKQRDADVPGLPHGSNVSMPSVAAQWTAQTRRTGLRGGRFGRGVGGVRRRRAPVRWWVRC